MLEVYFEALEDLDRRRARVPQPRSAGPLETHLEHLLATDPRSCFVAVEQGQVVAFGVVVRRGADAYLSLLFVRAAWQSRGLGRRIVDACLLGAGDDVERFSACSEADQPISTGLYASLGLAPRVPIYLLRGGLADDALPALPEWVYARPVTTATVATLDRELLGYERPQDHGFWARDRQGAVFVDDEERLLGYGYAHPSGRIGPVAALEPAWLPALIGYLVRVTHVREGRQVIVPGSAITALRPLLAAGLRIDGSPAIYCSQGPVLGFDRYVPASYALL